MTYLNGGRGKKAPYMTEMYRIPTPIKETVQLLAMAYRKVCDTDPITSPSHLLKQVQSTIALTNLISGTENKCLTEPNDDAVRRLEAIRELVDKWKGNSKDTRNWVECKRLLTELETALLTQNK